MSELNVLRSALDQWIKENPVVRRYQILNAAQTLEVLAIGAKISTAAAQVDIERSRPLVVDPTIAWEKHDTATPPTEVRDYFQRDRSGNALTEPPTGATLRLVLIQSRTESVDRKHLKVTFQGGKANCFDRELWPRMLAGQTVSLWIIEKGSYLNIVGVRA